MTDEEIKNENGKSREKYFYLDKKENGFYSVEDLLLS